MKSGKLPLVAQFFISGGPSITTAKKIWPHTEVAAHIDEILQLAASGEPQRINRSDGTVFVIQSQPAAAPAVRTGMSIYGDFSADTELFTERIKDTPRDVDL